MSTNIKYIQLLQQIASNPLRPKVAAAVDIVVDFEKDMEAIGLDRRLTVEGKREKSAGNLRRALRDLRDTRKTALDEHHAKTETMRTAVKRPAFDKSDVVGAMNRRELRDASRAMTFGQRAALMAGKTRDTDFIDAVLEQAPWVSGFDVHDPGAAEIYEAAKAERLRDLHGPLIDQIEERDAIESEARMILDVARDDLKMHSGMEDRVFADFAKPIESKANAHWLKRSTNFDGKEIIVVINPDGVSPSRIATEDEVRDGRFFKDFAEYQAARAA